jgi:hypothetical protein
MIPIFDGFHSLFSHMFLAIFFIVVHSEGFPQIVYPVAGAFVQTIAIKEGKSISGERFIRK